MGNAEEFLRTVSDGAAFSFWKMRVWLSTCAAQEQPREKIIRSLFSEPFRRNLSWDHDLRKRIYEQYLRPGILYIGK